ncbi:MAG: LacI family transcriptional regulator [Candidatus Pacebacteria bacterium]|nr:LacI family transcriptional regulator [Candidatus Paceibacterota bacterium]
MAGNGSLREVAERAGVSTATVSRVVNGRKGIAQATRKRVQSVIDDMGYVPDPKVGQFFKTVRGGIRGVAFALHPDLHGRIAHGGDGFYARMSLALHAELSRCEHHMILANSVTDGTPDGNLNCLAQGLCNGVIGQLRDPTLIARLARHAPLVLLNADHAVPYVDVVIPNVERAAEQQIAHLAALGHKKVACFRPRHAVDGSITWQDRRYWRAYRELCPEHGMSVPDEYLLPVDCDVDKDAVAIAQFLDQVFARPEIAPTAILTYDGYAGELIRQLGERGLQVPEDVSIVGYDDCTHDHPCPLALTTFRQDFQGMARHAVRLLLERLEDPKRSAVLMEVEGKFIERKSTAPPRLTAGSRVQKQEAYVS